MKPLFHPLIAVWPLNLFEGLPPDPKDYTVADLPLILANIIQLLLILIAVLAVIYIIYAGIKYIISEGDPGKIAEAKTGITNAIIGLVLSSVAYLIVDFIASRF
jgi:hypothetical protein